MVKFKWHFPSFIDGNYATCPHSVGTIYGGTVCSPTSATICNICLGNYATCPHSAGITYGNTYHVHTFSCAYHYTTHTHTAACPLFYGCKQYVTNNSTSVNCQGYAFFTNSWPSGWFSNDDYNYCINSNTTTEMMLNRTKERMVTWLNNNFSGRWQEVSDPSVDLNPNQWLICMRVGKKDFYGEMAYDYHYWYRTSTGVYANKHGSTPSVLLPSSDTPSTNSSSGWELWGFSPFYDSATVYYKVTE